MSIEKHVSTTWQVQNVLDSPSKVACWQAPTYVPPEIQSFMNRLKERGADPRFTYVHIVAMTDGDYYGQNLNGDVFSTDELTGMQSEQEAAKNRGDMCGVAVPRYKTFEQAKFYRNHANGDNDPYYGDVPCAAWNDPMRRVELIIRIAKKAVPELGMQDGKDITIKLDRRGYITVSMGCVCDPNTPVLTEGGYKPIKDVTTDDRVLTHTGKWAQVTATPRRRYTGEVRELKVAGLPEPLRLTSDHPLWSAMIRRHVQVQHGRNLLARELGAGEEIRDWVPVEHLVPGDLLFYRPPTITCAPITSLAFARLLGWFMADGSVGFQRDHTPSTVSISCNKLGDCSRDFGAVIAELLPGYEPTFRRQLSSEACHFAEVYNKDLATKVASLIPNGAFDKRIPLAVFGSTEEIRLAFLGAWFSGDGFANVAGLHLSSANRIALLQARDLLATLGVPSSTARLDHPEGGGMNTTDTVEYVLTVRTCDVDRLRPYATGKLSVLLTEEPAQAHKTMKAAPDGSFACPIRAVDVYDVEDLEVYNLAVEGDESYMLGGVISHNCRIAHEQCSICNNTNEFVHDRCEHLANQMNDVLPDGRVVSAKNFGMRFFDISDVGVPADPSAYSLAKVAAVDGTSHALPNVAFDADGYAEWRTKHSEMIKNVPCSDPVADLLPVHDPSRRTDIEPAAYSVDQLKKAVYAADGDIDTVLSTAAAAGIVFSPTELCTLTALTEPDKMASATFRGFRRITFDKVAKPVYDVLRSKLADRSGFVAPCYARGWEPAKLAEEGHTVVADYYAFYRDALGSLSRSTFVKAAHRLPYLREVVDAGGDPKAAMNHLAYAGILP